MKDWNIKEDKAQNAIYLKEDNGGKGRFFRARFLQAGLVKYSFGVCLLKKETIDKFVYKFVGCPVVIDHKDVSDKNAKDLRVGVISKVEFEQFDGWYWCEGVIFDQEAIDLVNNGYNVSCQYEITQYATNDRKELHNGNEYDKEILDGAPEHLAIVKNPRYESAMIAVNAIDLTASNEEKWITIKPHGEESDDYRRLKLEDGESPKEAIDRVYKKEDKSNKEKENTEKKEQTYYEPDMEETYTKAYEDSISKDFDDFMKAQKEKKEDTIEKYLTDKSDSGFLYQTKGTSTYHNAGKTAEVEEFGEDGGKYRVKYTNNSGRRDYKVYSTKSGMEKAVKSFLKDGDNKETQALSEKTNLEEKQNTYKDVLKKYNEADKKRWARDITNKEYHQAWDDYEKYKKELTKARREYAESIMANFEESDNNAYEEKQAARRERYTELSDRASKESSSAHQQFRDKMSFIPAGQPIHGAKDARYREKAWETLGRAVRLGDKADYYADKANSVGKAGISSDDANAIAKLAKKYKSGVDSAEKRRIIDRVIDLHQRKDIAAKGNEDFSDLGFKVERNSDINRLQLKFDGKPDESTRNILKSYGFRWSPREGAWQRQLTGNAEYSLKQVAEKLKANNSFVEEFKNTLYEVISGGIFERLGELVAQNKNSTEKWITIKGNHILLKDGESIADAFKRTTGASLSKGNKYEPKDSHSASESYTKILDRVREDNKKEISREEIITSAIKNLGLNENEVRLKIELAEKYNEGIKDRGLETQKLHSNSNGTYKREREEKHEKILDGIFKDSERAKPKNGEKPTVIFLGGRGGSGKSKFNGLVYDEKNYIVLDADEIKKQIEEYRGYNAFEVHEESSDILNRAIKIARRKGLNIVLDATMKTLSSTENKIKSFADDGYNVEMYYMHLPREKAAERAIGRFMGNNGRYVPLDILLSMKDNEENFDKLKKYASKWAFYNNDVAKKSDEPILIDKSK